MIIIVTVESKALLNIKEVCEYLGVGQNKARELVRGCNGFGVLLGGKWYAHKKKLDAWLDHEAM